MIIAVTEIIHDYEPKIAFYDTDLFDMSRHVEEKVMEAINKGKTWVSLQLFDWHQNPNKFPDESYLNLDQAAKLKDVPESLNRAIILFINLEG